MPQMLQRGDSLVRRERTGEVRPFHQTGNPVTLETCEGGGEGGVGLKLS